MPSNMLCAVPVLQAHPRSETPQPHSSLMTQHAGCRKMESEADEIGLSLAAKACFKPGTAVEVRPALVSCPCSCWQPWLIFAVVCPQVYKILDREEARQGGDHMPAMLRTHPLSSARIEAVRNLTAGPTAWLPAGLCQQQSCRA